MSNDAHVTHPFNVDHFDQPPMRAVQQVSSASVDWQVFDDQGPGSEAFQGTLFVVDEDGAQRFVLDWSGASDADADSALAARRLERTSPWEQDSYGRRSAAVTASNLETPRIDRHSTS